MHLVKNLTGNPPTEDLWSIVSRMKVTLDTETRGVGVRGAVEMRKKSWSLQVFALA